MGLDRRADPGRFEPGFAKAKAASPRATTERLSDGNRRLAEVENSSGGKPDPSVQLQNARIAPYLL